MMLIASRVTAVPACISGAKSTRYDAMHLFVIRPHPPHPANDEANNLLERVPPAAILPFTFCEGSDISQKRPHNQVYSSMLRAILGSASR